MINNILTGKIIDFSFTHHSGTISIIRVGDYCIATAKQTISGATWASPSAIIPEKFRPSSNVLIGNSLIQFNTTGFISAYGTDSSIYDGNNSKYDVGIYKCAS